MRSVASLVFGVAALAACGDEAVTAERADGDAVGEDVAPVAVETSVAEAAGDSGATSVTIDSADTVSAEPIGGERPARVVLPLAYDPERAWPLVLLLHGYSLPGSVQDFYLGFSTAAANAGFITVVPDGTKDGAGLPFWNASPGWCCDFGKSGVDDLGYLTNLVAEASARWHVDARKVYAFGHSNGGFMAHRLACARADVFAAVAALAGSLPAAGEDCVPSEPVSVLQIHGTADATILYGGTPAYPGAETVASRWASYDLCAAEPDVKDEVDFDNVILGAETTQRTWRDCDGKATVALWTLAGSGHIPLFSDAFVPAVLAWLGAQSN